MVDWLQISQTSGSGDTQILVRALPDTGHGRATTLVLSGLTKPPINIPVRQITTPMNMYLTLIIRSDGNLRWMHSDNNYPRTIQYSKDYGETWSSVTSTLGEQTSNVGGTLIPVSNGDVIFLKGNNQSYGGDSYYASFERTSVSYELEGNIMSLVYGDDFSDKSLTGGTLNFRNMFSLNTGLTSNMWLVLPNTTTLGCYAWMFQECSSLQNTVSVLPATTLAERSYEKMYKGCTTLINAPELPATTLSQRCYLNMFERCASLTTAPELPASTLAERCYEGMFSGCTNLNYVKCLARTNITTSNTSNWLYGVAETGTFFRDTSSTWSRGPSGIPYNWIVEYIPEIFEVSPTTFENIPSSGCTYQFTITSNVDWTITPFSNNSPLPLYFSATAGTPGTTVVTVTAGTNVDFERTSIFRVSGYTEHEDISFHQEGQTDYFRMVVTPTSGSGNIRFVVTKQAYASVLSYRKNLGDWTTITATTGGTYIRVNGGDTVEFIGNNNQSMGYSNGYNYFSSSGVMFDTEGNIMSLISSSYTLNTLYASFKNFFKGCTGLRKINSTWGDIRQVLDDEPFLGMYANCTNLIYAENALPNAELGNGYSRYAYYSMFEGCTKLTHPPIMYTTGFTKGCCYQMFKGCTSLVEPVTFSPNISFYDTGCFESMYEGCTSLKTAPELPATTLTEYCYNRMFAGCTSLTSAPELPATTLTKYCYYRMFAGCSSLTTAPALPASTMTEYCYTSMFQGCTSLTTAPALPATTLATDCYNGMFMGCTSLTTAPQLPATTLTSSCYAYMFSGCTSLTTAPVLPATALTSYCYREMFNGCTRLDYIKCLAIYNSAGACTAGWVVGVAPSGTFVKDSTASWTSGTSGIPSGWTVEDAT